MGTLNTLGDYMLFFAEGTAPMSEEMDPNRTYELADVRLHLDAGHASTVDFVVQVDAALGSAHDITLTTKAMNGVQDYFYQPTRPLLFRKGDKITFTLAQTSGAQTWGLWATAWAVRP